MTGYESKRAAARDKLEDDDTQVYQDHPAQEPVATLFGTLPVYDTAPPQRKPLPLDEISKLVDSCKADIEGEFLVQLVRATEAAHGIKENT